MTFASAYGGDQNHGQVWHYTPSNGTLWLLYETHNPDVLDTPTTSRSARAVEC